MIHKTLFVSMAILFAVTGCSNNDQHNTADIDTPVPQQKGATADTNIIKVYVDESGVITANGNMISLKSLDTSFSKLKEANGTVYYSRANGQGEPPAESVKVMGLVVKYELPIRLYTDKTFSVIVKPD